MDARRARVSARVSIAQRGVGGCFAQGFDTARLSPQGKDAAETPERPALAIHAAFTPHAAAEAVARYTGCRPTGALRLRRVLAIGWEIKEGYFYFPTSGVLTAVTGMRRRGIATVL